MSNRRHVWQSRTALRWALALCLITVPVFARQPPVLDPVMANLLALSESTGCGTAVLATHLSCDPSAQITYEGQATATDWSFALTGTYLGQPLHLQYQGVFDPNLNTGSFTGSGSFGPDAWSAQGAVIFSDNRELMLLDAKGSVGSRIPAWDERVNKQIDDLRDFRSDAGEEIITRDGKPIGRWIQFSFWDKLPPFERRLNKIEKAGPQRDCRIKLRETPEQVGDTTLVKGKIRVKLPS